MKLIDRLNERIDVLEAELSAAKKRERDNWKRKVMELRLMVQVFRGCIENKLIPSKGSPCHKKVEELLK